MYRSPWADMCLGIGWRWGAGEGWGQFLKSVMMNEAQGREKKKSLCECEFREEIWLN